MDDKERKEISFIKKIAGVFPRHPMQVNLLFEADGEIIDMRRKPLSYRVAKTDGIGKEIMEGLYKDPYRIGGMAVTVIMSDLLATGADPSTGAPTVNRLKMPLELLSVQFKRYRNQGGNHREESRCFLDSAFLSNRHTKLETCISLISKRTLGISRRHFNTRRET